MSARIGIRGACALLLTAFGGCSGEPEQPRVVVVFLLDALHAEHVHHLGYERETTPNLDLLAEEGVTFTQVFAPTPYTLASVPSLLTGRIPDRHKLVHRLQGGLSEEEVTFAEHLGASGWQTFGATANPNAGFYRNTHQGFDHFIEVQDGPGPEGAQIVETDQGRMHVPKASEFIPVLEEFLAARDPKRSALFYFHILEPHSPYDPPEPYRSRFLDPAYDGPFAAGDSQTLISTLHGRIEPTAADREAVRALYDANILYADSVVGEMFEMLRREGIWEDALVVVTSDHGEAMWQHGRWGHNSQLLDPMLRIPLILKVPANADLRDVRVDALASLCDVVPTLLDWADVPQSAGEDLDGISLRSLAHGATPDADRELLLRNIDDLPVYAARSSTRKLIVRPIEGGERLQWARDLYDLRSDPDEQRDIAASATKADGRRFKQLSDMAHAVGRRIRVPSERPEPNTAMLEALGYGGGR